MLTSTGFRLLATDIFVTAREILADAAVQVEDAADVVAGSAKTVESLVRPVEVEGKNPKPPSAAEAEKLLSKEEKTAIEAEEEIKRGFHESVEHEQRAWARLVDEGPDRISQTVRHRLKSVSCNQIGC